MLGEGFIVGNLVQDPYDWEGPSGTVTFIRLAVNYFGSEEANFLNLAVHGKAREAAAHLKKGDLAGFQVFITERTRDFDAEWTYGKHKGKKVRLPQTIYNVRRIYFKGLNMNHFVGSGRLTQEPLLRYTTDGRPVTNARIAIDSGKDHVNFIDLTIWGTMAEAFAQHKQKGDPIIVVGTMLLRDINPLSAEDLQNIRSIIESPEEAVDVPVEKLVEYIDKLYKRRRDVHIVASQIIWLPDRRNRDRQNEEATDEFPPIDDFEQQEKKTGDSKTQSNSNNKSEDDDFSKLFGDFDDERVPDIDSGNDDGDDIPWSLFE